MQIIGAEDDILAAQISREGEEAARGNKPREANPYDPGTYWYDCWFDGYDAAYEENP